LKKAKTALDEAQSTLNDLNEQLTKNQRLLNIKDKDIEKVFNFLIKVKCKNYIPQGKGSKCR
jgi:hypothetical protein